MHMSTKFQKARGTGIMFAMLLAAFAASAQEEVAGEDELLPAVDTSAVEAQQARVAQDITRTTTGAQVMDTIELSRTEVTGNQELPKVLYIVPWKKSDPGELLGKPVNTLLDEVLAPLDREEFIRQVDYYDDLNGTEQE